MNNFWFNLFTGISALIVAAAVVIGIFHVLADWGRLLAGYMKYLLAGLVLIPVVWMMVMWAEPAVRWCLDEARSIIPAAAGTAAGGSLPATGEAAAAPSALPPSVFAAPRGRSTSDCTPDYTRFIE